MDLVGIFWLTFVLALAGCKYDFCKYDFCLLSLLFRTLKITTLPIVHDCQLAARREIQFNIARRPMASLSEWRL